MGTSAGGESSTASATVSGTSATVTGLTNGTRYYVIVKAVNGGGASGPSNEVNAIPLPPAPPAPTNLAGTPGDAKVTLSWSASSGAISYSIYRGTSLGNESPTAIGTSTTADPCSIGNACVCVELSAVTVSSPRPAPNGAITSRCAVSPGW